MISTVIVLLTLAMAIGYSLAYVLRPAWRARIEAPKHCFQDQLQRYDRQIGLTASRDEEAP